MTIDTAKIRAAAEAAESRNWTHGANPVTVIALCDEIKRLRHENGMPLSMLGVDQLRQENDDLRREVERLRKDAARYQWLKRERVKENYEGELGIELECGFDHWDNIDASIDAAMEAK